MLDAWCWEELVLYLLSGPLPLDSWFADGPDASKDRARMAVR